MSNEWKLEKVGEIGVMVSSSSWELSYFESGRQDSYELSADEAKRRLRSLSDALNEHFAPVLRWDNNRCRANVGEWLLFANDTRWELSVVREWSILVLQGEGDGLLGCRRAAEAALRGLGVVFRVESEVST